MSFKEFLNKEIKESKVGDFLIDIQDTIYNAIKEKVDVNETKRVYEITDIDDLADNILNALIKKNYQIVPVENTNPEINY